NGNPFKPVPRTTANADGTSTLTIHGLFTTEEKAQKKNDVKARIMLLMALPNEHLLTFSQYRDAKTLFESIQAIFGGNDATKKTQRTLLKQMYKNFNAPSTESLDSIFNRLKKIVSQYDIMSIDDLYNNFKIIEQEVKRTVASSSSSRSLNMAFLFYPGSTNKVDTASIQVSYVNIPVSTVSSHDNATNLSDATMYAFLANQPNGSQLIYEDLEQIHEDDLEEMDLKWQLALLSMRARRWDILQGNTEVLGIKKASQRIKTAQERLNVEDTSSKAMVVIDGAGFDWSYMADDEVPTNMAFMAFSDSEKEKESNQIKIDNFENASKSLDKLIGSQITNNSRTGLGFTSYNVVAPPPTGLFAPPTINLSHSGLEEFQHPKFKGYGPKDMMRILKSDNVQHKPEKANQPRKVSQNPRNNRTNWNEISTQKLGVRRNFAPTAVLTKFGVVPISTARQSSSRAATPVSAARPINTAPSKPLVNLNNNVNTAKANSITTAKGNKVTSAVGNQGTNAVKSSTCWVWRPKIKVQDHVSKNSGSYVCKRSDYVDPEGRLKSMMEGMLPLGDELKVVRLVAKAQSKLMCDKKNNVLFTDTECFVLSPNFKLADESQVLLKVPRKNNMYSFDMKNIVPKKDLTCLLAKATNDESILWHKILDSSGPTSMSSIMHKKYYLVITDDFSRFTWQNGVAERRNRTLIEAARTMSEDSKLPTTFWAEAINTACSMQNMVLVVKPHFMTPYELFKDEGIFVGYSTTSIAFRVYNFRARKVEENLHITFLKNKPMIAGGGPEGLFNIDALSKSINYAPVPTGTNSNDFAGKGASFDAGQFSTETRSIQNYMNYGDTFLLRDKLRRSVRSLPVLFLFVGPFQASKSND
nr:hypothetical protein [Tanacetum cinerariifolium]